MKIKSVLIIDDEELEFYIAKKILENTKCFDYVYYAVNGKEALHLFKNHEESCKKYPTLFPPSLILLDINMPVMNGFEFLEAYQNFILTQETYPPSDIVIFTSSEQEYDKNQAMRFSYVKDYIVKPMNVQKAITIAQKLGKTGE